MVRNENFYDPDTTNVRVKREIIVPASEILDEIRSLTFPDTHAFYAIVVSEQGGEYFQLVIEPRKDDVARIKAKLSLVDNIDWARTKED